MSDFWKGAFLPKAIGSTRFIPLEEMTPEDWDLLDWDMLSNKAKNAIVAAALRGPVAGFMNYKFIAKGDRRRGYLFPILLSEDVADFEIEAPFDNSEDNELSDDAADVDEAIDRMRPVDGDKKKLYAAMLIALAAVKKKLNGDKRAALEKEIKNLRKVLQDGYIDDDAHESYTSLDVILFTLLKVLHIVEIKHLRELANSAYTAMDDIEETGLV